MFYPIVVFNGLQAASKLAITGVTALAAGSGIGYTAGHYVGNKPFRTKRVPLWGDEKETIKDFNETMKQSRKVALSARELALQDLEKSVGKTPKKKQ